jgi:hypothetical protein
MLVLQQNLQLSNTSRNQMYHDWMCVRVTDCEFTDWTVNQLGLLSLIHYLLLLVKLDMTLILEGVEGQMDSGESEA